MDKKSLPGCIKQENKIPIKITELTNKLWRPKHIAERINVSTRQITDFAERKIVIPAIDTTGAGTARLYDHTGIYSIMLASSIRGLLGPKGQGIFIQTILGEEENLENPLVLCIVRVFDKKIPHCTCTVDTTSDWDELPLILNSLSEGWLPQYHISTIVNLHAMKYALRKRFRE